jgi:hypothetical protein
MSTSEEKSSPRSAAERMRAYRARRRAAGLRLERRWVAPQEPRAATTYSDHSLHDARSLAMHCVIAQKLAREPRLLTIAKQNIAAWRKRSKARQAPAYLSEWVQILNYPMPQLLAFITAMTEEATRLRQSSPFAGILDPSERRRIVEAFRA